MTTAELVGTLFEARLEQQLSQEVVAARMGVTQASLSQLELRHRIGSIETFERWAAALGFELTLISTRAAAGVVGHYVAHPAGFRWVAAAPAEEER